MYSVTRAVARGEGDWAEVPHSVREAIVHTLSHPADAAFAHPTSDGPRLARSTSDHRSKKALLPSLSECDVQCSIDTFEDGLWVRDQAVRSYARFHNSVEALYRSSHGQLRPLWRTAMQLRPNFLEGVQKQHGLSPSDSIPEGVPIPQHYAVRVAHEKMILESMLQDLQRLRDASVKFAANWLTDDEKIAMGADPAYLQAKTINEDTLKQSCSREKDFYRNLLEKSETARPSHGFRSSTITDPHGKNIPSDEGLTMGDPKLIALLQQYAERLVEIQAKSDKELPRNMHKRKH